MPKYTLSGPGGQDTNVEATDLDDAALMARRFGQRYGIIGGVQIYDDSQTEPLMEQRRAPDKRPIYMFIYCASEHGSLYRHCDDDTAARKHAHILADAHGESCHIFRALGQDPTDQYTPVGRVEPRIPKN
jgi:hypothetical protein